MRCWGREPGAAPGSAEQGMQRSEVFSPKKADNCIGYIYLRWHCCGSKDVINYDSFTSYVRSNKTIMG